MKNAKLELKKVKMFKGHDGVGLDADLYFNGNKVAHVFDDARGGEIEFQEYGNTIEEIRANRQILLDLEEYAKTLPKKETYPQTLEDIINDILSSQEKDKQAKKLVKEFEIKICAGVKSGESYRFWSFGKPKIKLSLVPIVKLQEAVDRIKTQLKPGEKILNTNLGALGIKI